MTDAWTYDDCKDWIFKNLPDYVPPKRVGDFSKFVMPIIKNMPPEHELIDQLIAVQPMAGPVRQIFYGDLMPQ